MSAPCLTSDKVGSQSRIQVVGKEVGAKREVNDWEDRRRSYAMHCTGSFREEVSRIRKILRKQNGGVLLPNSRFMRRWDMLTIGMLLFTAVVTPVEVGFFEVSLSNALFYINRIVDLVFVTDIFINFILAYYDDAKGGMLIKRRVLIARHYLHTWFAVDLLSVIPFDLLALLAKSSILGSLRAIRLIRLLRLLKLLRVIRANRLLARYETRFAISYAKVAMTKYLCILLVISHWMACAWGMALSIQGENTYSWIDLLEKRTMIEREDSQNALYDIRFQPTFNKKSVTDQYIRSIYFSVYLITSIGLGDVVPVTNLEAMLCTVFMIIGAVMWAYTVGNFCSIVSTMDSTNIEFRQRMDALNYMLAERRFPHELRERCRMFYHQSKEQNRIYAYRKLENCFSKSLRSEVAIASNSKWISKVWYLADITNSGFIADVSQLLEPYTAAPAEIFEQSFTLFILRRGVAARNGRVLSCGSVWGEDFVILNDALVDKRYAAALTYTEVLTLQWPSFGQLCEDYPQVQKIIANARLFYTVRARLILLGREAKARRISQVQHRCDHKSKLLNSLAKDEPVAPRKIRRNGTTAEAHPSHNVPPSPPAIIQHSTNFFPQLPR